jgi:hypothetical protein
LQSIKLYRQLQEKKEKTKKKKTKKRRKKTTYINNYFFLLFFKGGSSALGYNPLVIGLSVGIPLFSVISLIACFVARRQ